MDALQIIKKLDWCTLEPASEARVYVQDSEDCDSRPLTEDEWNARITREQLGADRDDEHWLLVHKYASAHAMPAAIKLRVRQATVRHILEAISKQTIKKGAHAVADFVYFEGITKVSDCEFRVMMGS